MMILCGLLEPWSFVSRGRSGAVDRGGLRFFEYFRMDGNVFGMVVSDADV